MLNNKKYVLASLIVAALTSSIAFAEVHVGNTNDNPPPPPPPPSSQNHGGPIHNN